ncbi:MAG: HD domain-containing protein [Clostridia bacterium]|nr:HD domain-containing protein [Clostridia bacterium]
MQKIAQIIRENGGTLYLVGGAVRDKFLENKQVDEDYCATGLTKEKFQKLFPKAKIQGKDFPVFILEGKEIALARKERKTGIGHKEFEFLANETITIQEDLARRDITINSMAQNVLTKEIIDPFCGRKDIERKIIRKTSNAFSEDPLRVYRVARFAASLDFKVELNTLKSMQELKHELTTLSKERVFTEFEKALKTNKPSNFFNILRKAQVLGVHFPEIENLIGKVQPEKYHPEGDSYNHTMIVVDSSSKLTSYVPIRFACLVHDLGKGTTKPEILPHHYGHDERGVEQVANMANRIGLPKAWIKCGKTACKWHMKAGIFEKMTAKKKVELVEHVSKTMLGLEGLKIVVACDKAREEKDLQERLNEIQFARVGKECLTKINGEYIQKKYSNVKEKDFATYLHEERVKWWKAIDKNN